MNDQMKFDRCLFGDLLFINSCLTVKDFFFFVVALRPNAGHGLLTLDVSRSHTTTHHSR